jgi:SAM-dependent methyltransferase
MICDIGCGLGQSLAHYDGIVGVDLSLPYLVFAKKRTERDVVLADAHFLPFRSECFDGIILHDVLEHLKDPRKALSEVCKVLKRGGKLVITTPDSTKTRILYRLNIGKNIGYPRFSATLKRWLREEAIKVYLLKRHIHEFAPSELTELLRISGFRVIRVRGVTIPFIPYSLWPLTLLNKNKLIFFIWKALDRLWEVYFNGKSLWEMFVLAIKTWERP